MRLIKASLVAAVIFISGWLPAVAQTSPNFTYGFVPTVAQWNGYFSGKQDYLGAPPLVTSGGTMTGPLITAASTTLQAGLNVPPGSAPTSPNNGDFWSTSSGFYGQVNGVTVGPFAQGTSGSFSATSPLVVTFPGGGVVNYAFNFSVANTFLAQQTDQGATTTTPGWYAQIAGDTFARVRVGLNSTDVPSLAFGPGNAVRDAFLERVGAGSFRLGAPDAAAPVAQFLSLQNVVAGTANTAGSALTISGSRGTGTGAGGDILFQIAPAGSSGSTQNALANALHIFGTDGGATLGSPTGGDKGAFTLNSQGLLYVQGNAVAASAATPLVLNASTGALTCPTCLTGTGGALTAGVTTTSGYTNGQILGSNGTVLSVYAVNGSGNVVLTTGASLVTPAIGVATGTSLALGGATLGGNSFAVTGSAAISGALTGLTTLSMSGQLTSTLATGTAPFSVASTTNVANLNASSLGGATFAAPGPIGSTTASTGAFTTMTGTSLALGGATIGSNALAVTGTALFNSAVTHSGTTTLSGALTYGGVTLANSVVGTGSMVLATSPTVSGLTVTGAFTATGLVTNADLVNPATTVNGQTCTLGGTCTIIASAGSITYGTTTAGTSVGIPYNTTNGGALAALTPVSGGVLYGASATTPAFSAALTQYGVVYGGGVGAAPATTAAGTAGQMLLGQSTAPSFQTTGGDVASLSNTGSFVFAATNTHITTLANLTTVGTIGTGVWQGSVIGATYLPTASPSAYGLVKYDGVTITLNGSNQLQASGAAATSITPLTTTVSGGTNGDLLGVTNSGCVSGSPCLSQFTFASLLIAPTPAVFDTGTSVTYTTPANTLYLRVTITAGGGGGAGGASGAGNGSTGATTTFGSFTVIGGGGATTGPAAGAGGTGGTGTCNLGRSAGGNGFNPNQTLPGNTLGGSSIYGSGTAPGGGGGGGGGATNIGSGGGAGESCDLIIAAPAATYTYTVGPGGTGGTAGSGGGPGIGGGNGRIKIVAYAQ